jgi:hypothetical protein
LPVGVRAEHSRFRIFQLLLGVKLGFGFETTRFPGGWPTKLLLARHHNGSIEFGKTRRDTGPVVTAERIFGEICLPYLSIDFAFLAFIGVDKRVSQR